MHHGVLRPLAARRGHAVADDQPVGTGTDRHRLAVQHVTGQDHLGQRILQRPLDHPLQRAGAIDRVIAFLGQPGLGGRVDVQRDLPPCQPLFKLPQLDRHDAHHVVPAQPVEDDLIIQAVQEFGLEVGADRFHHLAPRRARVLPVGKLA